MNPQTQPPPPNIQHDGTTALLRLETLCLVDLKIPTPSLLTWLEGLAHHARLQHLELVGVLGTKQRQQHVEKMIALVHQGNYPHLQTLIIDDRCVIGQPSLPSTLTTSN